MSVTKNSGVNHAVLSKIAAMFELPEYVKDASTESLTPPDPANIGSYASIRPTPSLPIHNKAACWLSAIEYALETSPRPNDQHVQRQLNKAAEFFGIAHDIERALTGHVEQLQKHASGDEKYPVRNAQEAEAAQRFLLKNAGTPTISDLDAHLLADKVVGWLGTKAEDKILKMAGFGGISNIQAFASAVGGKTSLETELSIQGLDQINQLLPDIIKTAAMLNTAPTPWEAIQHDSPLVKVAGDYYTETSVRNMSPVYYEAICGEQPYYECDRVTKLQEKLANGDEFKKTLLRKAIGEPVVAEKRSSRLNLVGAVLLDAMQEAVSAQN